MTSPLQNYLTSSAERGAGPSAPAVGDEPMSYVDLGLETN